jgi:phosphonate transport system substrate-binding protein
MSFPLLRFTTFLAPKMLPVYSHMVEWIGRRIGVRATLCVGSCYDELSNGIDAAFVCGLAYIEMVRQSRADLEPLAAPLLIGERFSGRPTYYSDVVVHQDSPFRRFSDLRGCSWAYNEPYSHSGYGITLYRLLQLGEIDGFFGRVVEAGWHERSIQLVASGEVDASAIDCQVLAITLREQPELAAQLRVIESLGPSTIQPLVVSRRLPGWLKNAILDIVLEMHEDAEAQRFFHHGFIERFVAVSDSSYDDLRAMRAACEKARFLTLR